VRWRRAGQQLTENGSFATDRTRFCELTQMVPIDLILDALEHVDPVIQPPHEVSPAAPWRTPCLEAVA
jgi:hypothetical protein